MKTSRQNFIRNTTILGIAIFFFPVYSCKNSNKAGILLEKIGVCSNISNNGILEGAGYSYVEESVQSFLVPLQDDSVFNQKTALLKVSKLSVPACNNFIPGKLKSVGPDAVHDEILKYVETAFRRAEMADSQ